MKRFWIAAAITFAGLAGAAQAQDSAVAAKVEALARLQSASTPTLSPDGRSMAYLSNETGSPQIWVRDLGSDAPPRQLTRLPDPVGGVMWSPRGDLIAYIVAPGGGLNAQVWVMKPDGSSPRRLTAGGKETNYLQGWSRDGGSLMVGTNKDNPAAIDAALIDVATGKWTMLTSGKGADYLVDVRAGRAVFGRVVSRGDSNAFSIDLKTGEETLITGHEGKAETDWGQLSADGKTVYVASNVDRDRAAFGVITLDGPEGPSPVRYLAVRDDAVADYGVLSEDGKLAALSWNANGRSELAWLDTATGKVTPGPKLPIDIGGPTEFSRDGRTLVLAGSTANTTTDIYLLDVASGKTTRVTQSRHDGVDLAGLIRPELIEYSAPDGVKLSGWLYRPTVAKGPMPLVFLYHGGPEGQARPTLNADAQALVANGIAVFAPNVRGSSGFGKAFMAMDDGAKRVDGVRDIKATTDALVSMGIADPKRLGIMGGSYGGYMVMAGVTEYPDMFAAGVNLFGVVNFESFFRETEPWMAAMSTIEYGDPVTEPEMLRRLSPIHKLDAIRTPLFVLHGANDTNVPVVEAEQIVTSLRARGVPVKYTLFPDEGHGWRKTPNRIRSTTEIVAFFVEHLKP